MTEDRPHIVFAKIDPGEVLFFPNYLAAHAYWKSVHTFQAPFVIATVGREIDPSTPVIDPSE